MDRKQGYFILISTFVVILAWVIFSIVGSAFHSTISETLNIQITPITPSFDMQTLNALKKREIVIPLLINETPIASTPALPTPQPEGTSSALPDAIESEQTP